MTERFELSTERIREIKVNPEGLEQFRPYFSAQAQWILLCAGEYERIQKEGPLGNRTLEELKEKNEILYGDIIGEGYERSYANPAYAVKVFGKDYGAFFSVLSAELRSLIAFAYEGKLSELVIREELFLEVYSSFLCAFSDSGSAPEIKELKEIFYWFISDYSDEAYERKIKSQVDWEEDFAVRIIMDSDLSDLRYLYAYGERVTETELKTAAFINSLPDETIEKMAATFTGGFIRGFEVVKKDLGRKKSVNIRYSLGFERVVKRAIEQFAGRGLKPVIYRAGTDLYTRTGISKIGYYGALANPQFDYDHKEDFAYILDGHLLTRKIECLTQAFELYKEKAALLAGPACMEIFGEPTFIPIEKEENLRYSKKQQPLVVEERMKAGEVANRYIKREERSFTIIAFPTAAIGEDFPAIFRDILTVNTLDSSLYETIQQTIIDALDQADFVHIRGMNGNVTDLTVMLAELKDPEKETKFENCVADVNIPVGEVFTTPKLKGTDGVLHTTKVFLNELEYRNLKLRFKDGVIADYSCDNENGKSFIEENLLFHHKTLPIGEFAIGTNTYAYVLARKYGIEALMPVLIAEKTGPHFAMGDSCYSQEEEVRVFNGNGKEIIAKENDFSLLRRTEPENAYFYCHTDITIPYEELGLLEAVCPDGKRIKIIEGGRFVLPGTEGLNLPFSSGDSPVSLDE